MASIKNYQATWNALIKEKAKDELVPYWNVDGKIFHSKIKAELFAEKNKSSVQWNLHDGLYTNRNWSEKWNSEVIANKLHYLREKYQHLRLWYSGGIDSQIILETSIKQHIPIDEIAIFVGLPGSYGDHEAEIRTKPYLEKYKKQFKNTNILWCKLEKSDWIKFYDPNVFIEQSGVNYYNDRPATRSFLYNHTQYSEKLWEPYQNNKTVCDIFGEIFPKIIKLKDEWFWWAVDDDIGHNLSPFGDRFYMSYTMPELITYFGKRLIEFIPNDYTNSAFLPSEEIGKLKMKVVQDLINFEHREDHLFKGQIKNCINFIEMNDNKVAEQSWKLYKFLLSNSQSYKKHATDTADQKKEVLVKFPGIFSKFFGLDSQTIKFISENILEEQFATPTHNIEKDRYSVLIHNYKEQWQKYLETFNNITNDSQLS